MLFEEKGDIRNSGELVAKLNPGLGTVDSLILLDRPADVDVIDQRFLFQFGELRGFGGADDDFEFSIPEFGDHHEKEEEDEDDIRQGSGGDRRSAFSAFFPKFCHYLTI